MVTPDSMHCSQKPFPFLALLHGILFQSGRKRRKYCLLSKAIKVLNDEAPDTIVEHLAVFAHYQLVAKPVTFFEGELVCIVVLNFTDVQGELRPGFVNGNIWAMLRLQDNKTGSVNGTTNRGPCVMDSVDSKM
jgi:hypothetical protein